MNFDSISENSWAIDFIARTLVLKKDVCIMIFGSLVLLSMHNFSKANSTRHIGLKRNLKDKLT